MSDFANNILGNNFTTVQDATAHSQINDLIDNNDLVDIDEQMHSILSQQPPLEQTIGPSNEIPFAGPTDADLLTMLIPGAGAIKGVRAAGKGVKTIADYYAKNKKSVENLKTLADKARNKGNITKYGKKQQNLNIEPQNLKLYEGLARNVRLNEPGIFSTDNIIDALTKFGLVGGGFSALEKSGLIHKASDKLTNVIENLLSRE